MKFSIIISSALNLFRKQSSQTFKIFIVSTLFSVGLVLLFCGYYYIDFFFNEIKRDSVMTVVFKQDTFEDQINDFLFKVKNKAEVEDIDFYKANEAADLFKNKYNFKNDSLLIAKSFPAIAILKLKTKELNSLKIGLLSGYIEQHKIVAASKFDMDYLINLEETQNYVKNISILIGIFLALILMLLLIYSYRNVSESFKEEYDLLSDLGAPRLFSITPSVFYISFTSIIGVAFGLSISILGGAFFLDASELYVFDASKPLLLSFFASQIIIMSVAFMSIILSSKKKLSIA